MAVSVVVALGIGIEPPLCRPTRGLGRWKGNPGLPCISFRDPVRVAQRPDVPPRCGWLSPLVVVEALAVGHSHAETPCPVPRCNASTTMFRIDSGYYSLPAFVPLHYHNLQYSFGEQGLGTVVHLQGLDLARGCVLPRSGHLGE